ncbi:tyrosine-type recombinase/integrase, partial [Pseudophaeobacter arcticus]|uniref:tyrosine-type recombinase/integrase n=1 Tax=Pseudophaeobacter arcticus TaxID=385492 RepID=UPI00333E9AE4
GEVKSRRLRSDAISTILRNRLAEAGIEPDGYSGHSLRAGLATSAIKAGVPTYKVRAQTGHASDQMLSRYVRVAGLFDDNAAGALL